MIEIRITKDGDNIIIAFDGHAGYEQTGRDIVCAGVSALFYTLSLGMHKIAPDFSSTDGKTVTVEKDSPEIRGALTTVFEGLSAIAEQYPNCVRIVGRTSLGV